MFKAEYFTQYGNEIDYRNQIRELPLSFLRAVPGMTPAKIKELDAGGIIHLNDSIYWKGGNI